MTAYEHSSFGPQLSFKAASVLSDKLAVKLDTTANQVVPVASVNDQPFGVAHDVASSVGDVIPVYGPHNVAKVVAAASIGVGADAGVASTNGNLGPVTAASGVVKYRVGYSLTAAAAGETFSLFVAPRQLSGIA